MKNKSFYYFIPTLVLGAALGSLVGEFDPGIILWTHLWQYLKTMLLLLPPVFVLIGLFEVWVKQETIEKHFGESHGINAWFWLILLSSTTIGGLYVSLPIGYTLYKKGTRLRLVYGFLGFSTICRIPMTFFEASFLGLKFTLLRYVISLPLVILSAMVLEKAVNKKGLRADS